MLKKGLIVVPFLFIFMLQAVSAEITITFPEKYEYNLGESLAASISVKEVEDYSGFFKLQIMCDTRNIQYYVVPLFVEAESRVEVPIPTIIIPEGAKGTCKLRADFEKGNGDKIAAAFSKQFTVSDSVFISIAETNKVRPGDTIVISASIVKENGQIMEEGTATVTFNDYKSTVDFNNGKLSHTIDIGYVARGFYALRIDVSDKHGNKGEMVAQLEVEGVPKRIENKFSKTNVIPGDTVLLTPMLLDQTDQNLNKTVAVSIYDPKSNIVFEQSVLSGEMLEIPITQEFSPGSFNLKSQHGEVESQSSITVLIYPMIHMEQQGSKVIVKNTGNVRFKEEVSIALKQGDNSILVNRKINLKVGEKTTIDLSKYVEGGEYTVVLPEEYSDVGENTVNLADNRNALRKSTSSLNSITGNAVQSTRDVVASPFFMLFIVFILIAIVIFVFGKGMFKGMTRKKDRVDTKDIFKDYKFR